MPMPESFLFLTLRVFSATGGIEKICRIMGKALYEKSKMDLCRIDVYSSHDDPHHANENPYFPSESFRGFSGSKWRFIFSAVRKGIGRSHVILSHVNLLPAGWIIRLLSPKTKLILLAHGIEVWEMPLGIKKYMLSSCSRILCVSEFTRERMMDLYPLPPGRCTVLNNCLDPYLPPIEKKADKSYIRQQHGISEHDTLLFTLTRMQSSERYKGYDRVIEAMSHLKDPFPKLKYLLAGKYDQEEEIYIRSLISGKGMEGKVFLSGYIDDKDIPAYFEAADIYIMPSYREGFGIVFIEAMYYGLPVIAGNRDGSVDALSGGEFGLLADPHDTASVESAIKTMIGKREQWLPDPEKLGARFGYPVYRERFLNAIRFN